MFPPSRLLRSNSNVNHAFAAPRNAINNEMANFTCGLSAFPRLNKFLNLERYATTFSFYMLLCGAFVLNGIAFTYIKETSTVWSQQFGLLRYQWLIYIPFIFAGTFSVVIAYFGNKLERPSCIGGFFFCSSLAATILIIVEYHHYKIPETASNLCRINDTNNEPEAPEIGFGALLTFQIFEGFTYASLITNGITYIDDHLKLKYGALFLSVLFAFYKIGMQLGIMMSLVTIYLEQKTFSSILWFVFTALTFLFGLLIIMFPKILPSKITQQGVAAILDSNMVVSTKEKNTDGFSTMVIKILSNFVIWFTILSASLMEIATTNFELIQSDTYKTKTGTIFSTYSNPYIAWLYSHFITIPSEIFAILIIGIIIYKFQIRPRNLCLYICFTYILVAISFGLSSFFKCRVEIFNDNREVLSFCNLDCKCNMDGFQPICLQNITYYSPCFAGCNIAEYSDCKCGRTEEGIHAKEGICNTENCLSTWIIEELDKVNRKMLLASSKIMYPLIVIRSVPDPYKAVGLGFLIMGTKLFPYIPSKLVYDYLKVLLCLKWDSKLNCGIYNRNFPTYVSSITTAIMALAIIMVVLMLIFVKNLDLYSERKSLLQERRSRIVVLPKTIIEENEDEETSWNGNNAENVSTNPKPEEKELFYNTVGQISSDELTTLIPTRKNIAITEISNTDGKKTNQMWSSSKSSDEDLSIQATSQDSSNSAKIISTETQSAALTHSNVNLSIGNKPKRKETSF